jgi:hypothetical protein
VEKTVEVPLEDWVKKIVEETAVIAVERAIEHHAESCPLNTELRNKIMGNGKPSWDVRIDRLERSSLSGLVSLSGEASLI